MQHTWRHTLNHWLHGVRFYIAIAIILLSLQIWWWANASYAGTSLFAIRLEEAYAWFSIGFLCVALAIGPLFSVFRRLPGRSIAFDSRRLIGIGAAWFATLHIVVAYLSLFKLANPLDVPGYYRSAFWVGVLAWIILLAMAFTSFNAAFRRMGKWWFRLHRFVYVAIAFSLLHAFTIGAQATRLPVLYTLGAIAVVLLTLHCLAIIKQGRKASFWQLLTVTAMVAALVIIFSFGFHQRNQYQALAAGQGVSYAQVHYSN